MSKEEHRHFGVPNFDTHTHTHTHTVHTLILFSNICFLVFRQHRETCHSFFPVFGGGGGPLRSDTATPFAVSSDSPCRTLRRTSGRSNLEALRRPGTSKTRESGPCGETTLKLSWCDRGSPMVSLRESPGSFHFSFPERQQVLYIGLGGLVDQVSTVTRVT